MLLLSTSSSAAQTRRTSVSIAARALSARAPRVLLDGMDLAVQSKGNDGDVDEGTGRVSTTVSASAGNPATGAPGAGDAEAVFVCLRMKEQEGRFSLRRNSGANPRYSPSLSPISALSPSLLLVAFACASAVVISYNLCSCALALPIRPSRLSPLANLPCTAYPPPRGHASAFLVVISGFSRRQQGEAGIIVYDFSGTAVDGSTANAPPLQQYTDTLVSNGVEWSYITSSSDFNSLTTSPANVGAFAADIASA
ncbi:hypothetical protein C8R45DRAFT_1221203 [Mycena sanguinolenta]|nr:hypothetical protein C8R45DRAFT_1221203 [Mycena sanguinolenta]